MKNKKINITKKDIILVGAGHANIEVLRAFANKPLHGYRITLISDKSMAIYSGMVPGYIAGRYSLEEICIDLVKLSYRLNFRLIIAKVQNISALKKLIYLDKRPAISFDYLSINLGIMSKTSSIEGAKKYAISLKPISQIETKLSKITRIKSSTINKSIVLIGAGAAGTEVSLALRERFRKENYFPKIFILSNHGGVLKGYNKKAQNIMLMSLKKNNIQLITDVSVNKIYRNRVIYNRNKVITNTFVILSTSAAPLKLFSKTDLKLSEKGFIQVDSYLKCIGRNNIFAAGDNADILGKSLDKAGVYAVRQGRILARNIRRSILNKKLRAYVPQKSYLSLIGISKDLALGAKLGFAIKSNLIWKIKEYIDRNFIRRYSLNNLNLNNEFIDSEDPYDHDMQCDGCGSKLPVRILNKIFKDNITKGSYDADKIPTSNNLYQSIDAISSIVQDPYILGKIAAKHALNDIYASCCKPIAAQMLISLPPSKIRINERDLYQISQGALSMLKKNNCKLNGGHSFNSNNDQTLVGFSVIGRKIPLKKISSNKKSDIILTGKIGSAACMSGIKQNLLSGSYYEELLEDMQKNDKEISSVISNYNIRSITDISGYGLAIHLYNLLLRDKKLPGFLIDLDKIPLYEGAKVAFRNKIFSSLAASNKKFIDKKLIIKNKKQNILPLLYDPQTSGGFILIAPKSFELIKNLNKKGILANKIGSLLQNNRKITIQ